MPVSGKTLNCLPDMTSYWKMMGFMANFKIKYTLKLVTSILLIICFFTTLYEDKPLGKYLKHVSSVSIGGNRGRRILIGGDHCLENSLVGSVLQGRNYKQLKNKVKLCHLKTYGNDIVEECRKEFLDLKNEVNITLRSPSLMWFKGELVVSLRMRLYPFGRGAHNCGGFSCNHIYLRHYDEYLNPIKERKIITLRTPIETRHQERSGPHDPRLFSVNNSLYSLFATGYNQGWLSGIWDHGRQKLFIPGVETQLHHDKGAIHEKNWVPVIIKDELFIIRHLDPLQIMKCKIHDSCKFITNTTDALKFKMDDEATPLRGGTAFELHKYPYYIGFGHTTNYLKGHYRYYGVHLIVLCVHPFRIVYISDPLKIHPDMYSNLPKQNLWKMVLGDFFFPVGVMLEDEDSIVIGAHIKDMVSVLFRLTGLRDLLSTVMRLDSTETGKGNGNQPLVMSIQEYLVQRAQQKKWNSTVNI